MKLLSVFTETHYSFEGQRPDEHVIAFLYRHWFILLIRLVAYVLMAFVPIIGYIIFLNVPNLAYLQNAYLVLAVLFYLFWWYSLFYMVTMYYLDTWIVTNQRVIDSEQHGFFSRMVAELSLLKVQDVSTDIEGPMATWLKYGNLEIQTAGKNEKFEFKQVPDPVGVKDILMRAHNEYMAEHPNGIDIQEDEGL